MSPIVVSIGFVVAALILLWALVEVLARVVRMRRRRRRRRGDARNWVTFDARTIRHMRGADPLLSGRDARELQARSHHNGHANGHAHNGHSPNGKQ